VFKHINIYIFLFVLVIIPLHGFTTNIKESDDDWADDSWGEETNSSWQLSGFTELAYGTFLQSNQVSSTNSLSEVRTQLTLVYSHEQFELSAKGNLIYDDVLGKAIWYFRELNLSLSPADFLDIKVGRQLLTWGTSDYLFINDLFPKDWQSFFSGRDDEYLKSASNSIKTSWYFGKFIFDLTWTP